MPGYARKKTDGRDRLQVALARFRLCAEAFKRQTDRERDDLAFQVPANHWPDEWQAARKGQIIANVPIPPRPMLSIPKLDQTFQMLDNQMRGAHLAINVHAETDADDETANLLQDLYRHIEVTSRANLARNWAYQRAYKCGRGAYKIDKVYDADSPAPNDQKIVIKRLLDQSCAYFDPFAQEPDFSDMRFAFEAAWIPAELYEDRFPNSALAAMDGGELEVLAHQMPDFISGDEESRAYLVAGYWCVKLTKGEGGPDTRSVWYSLINGVEELEPETEWDGKWIPLVPVIGRELIPFDGERIWTGVIGPAKDGQRLFDVAASNVVEKIGLDTKAPWIAAEGQDEGHETEWQLSAVRNFPMLMYKPVMVQNQLVPPPQKNTSGVNISGDLQLLQIAGGFIQDATTTVDQSRLEALAKQRVAHQTIGSLASAGEAGRSDFLSNLVDISLPYEAKVILDLIPHVYDREGRVLRVRNSEGKTRPVMINHPYVPDPTGRPMPIPPGMPMPPGAKMHDLTKGTFGVVVDVGKGFPTQNAEQAAQYTALFQADPQAIAAFLPFFMKAQDFPPEAIARAEKMVPPPLRDNPNQDPVAMQGQIAQMQKAMQAMHAELQKAQQTIATQTVKAQHDLQKTKMDTANDLVLQIMKDATQIAVAKIQASAKTAIAASQAEDEAIALGREHAHIAAEGERERGQRLALAVAASQDQAIGDAQGRAHDVGLAAVQAVQAREAAQQAAQAGNGGPPEAAPEPGPEGGP